MHSVQEAQEAVGEGQLANQLKAGQTEPESEVYQHQALQLARHRGEPADEQAEQRRTVHNRPSAERRRRPAPELYDLRQAQLKAEA